MDRRAVRRPAVHRAYSGRDEVFLASALRFSRSALVFGAVARKYEADT